MSALTPAVRLFVGGHAGRVLSADGLTWEREDLGGDRCFTAAHPADTLNPKAGPVTCLLDSGAFTDVSRTRLTPEAALTRQLTWEQKLSTKWGTPFRAAYLASYDLLIDETWVPGQGKVKRRWTVAAGDAAVQATVDAAAYLSRQRSRLQPRTLVLGVQGVDPVQYAECVAGVLTVARPGDWIGLGGWCILGRFTTWLPVFWSTLHLVVPLIAAAGIRHVHLYGVLYRLALGGLVWLADQYGLTVSADSAAPIMVCTRRDTSKSKPRYPYWRDNVRYWIDALAALRTSVYYAPPAAIPASRQLTLWEGAA